LGWAAVIKMRKKEGRKKKEKALAKVTDPVIKKLGKDRKTWTRGVKEGKKPALKIAKGTSGVYLARGKKELQHALFQWGRKKDHQRQSYLQGGKEGGSY